MYFLWMLFSAVSCGGTKGMSQSADARTVIYLYSLPYFHTTLCESVLLIFKMRMLPHQVQKSGDFMNLIQSVDYT